MGDVGVDVQIQKARVQYTPWAMQTFLFSMQLLEQQHHLRLCISYISSYFLFSFIYFGSKWKMKKNIQFVKFITSDFSFKKTNLEILSVFFHKT